MLVSSPVNVLTVIKMTDVGVAIFSLTLENENWEKLVC